MGAAAVGATIFLPLFMQVVIGATAGNSGLLITPLMIGITVGALVDRPLHPLDRALQDSSRSSASASPRWPSSASST